MNAKQGFRASGTMHLIRAMAIGAAVSLAVIAAACMLCAFLMERQVLPEGTHDICIVCICFIGAGAGAFLSQRLAGRARLPVCLGSAAMLLLALGVIRNALQSGSELSWRSLPAAAISAAVCALICAGRGK